MDTTTTAAVYEGLRKRLIDYAPPTGATLRARGFKVYAGYVPDSAAYPYAIIRLMGMVTDTFGVRERGQLEVMLLARPRDPWGTQLEVYADVIDQAMHNFTDVRNGGLAFSRSRSRDTLPPFPDPADREVVQIRLVYQLTLYPQFLTTLGTGYTNSTT